MIRLSIVLLGCFVVGTPTAGADSVRAPARNNNITVSPVGYGISVSYARILYPQAAIRVTGTVLPPGIKTYTLLGGGIAVDLGAEDDHRGGFFSFGLWLNHTSDAEVMDSPSTRDTTSVAFSFVMGWRWQIAAGFNTALGIGWGYRQAVLPGESKETEGEGLHIMPVLDVGYSF